MKHVFIYSGKGGVGKSTIATNLAMTLTNLGYKVGLCDLDLHTPSIPLLLKNIKFESNMKIDKNLKIIPAKIKNMMITSSGLLNTGPEALEWNSDYEEGALHQMCLEVEWNADYLIIDLPPSINNIHYELVKKVKKAMIIIITNPNELTYSDCEKGLNFFKKFNFTEYMHIENLINGKRNDKRSLAFSRKIIKIKDRAIFLPHYKKILKSTKEGIPIIQNDKYMKRVFLKIAEKIK